MEDNDKIRMANRILYEMFEGKREVSWEDFRKSTHHIQLMPTKFHVNRLGLFRASFISDDDVLKNSKSRFGCPPPDRCTKNGRCNIAGYPVFYGANKFIGALQEAIMTGDDPLILDNYDKTIYVSYWELRGPKDYFSFDVSISYPERPSEKEKLMRRHQELITKLFRIRNHSFSSGLSFLYLYGIKKADKIFPILEGEKILIYPSILKDGSFINYALTPNFANSNEIKLVKVFKILVPLNNWYEAFKQINTYPIRILSVGELLHSDGQTIFWRGLNSVDRAFLKVHGLNEVRGTPQETWIVGHPSWQYLK